MARILIPGYAERKKTVDHIVSASPTFFMLSISKDMIELLVSYTGYYVKTLTFPAQKNDINIHYNQ